MFDLFFNDTATTEIYTYGHTLSLHDALPICTGGMVCAALTDIAGSSDVFSGGFITYSADAKKTQLEVSGEILETFGEVSLATAWAMAAGALANSDADVAVAIKIGRAHV